MAIKVFLILLGCVLVGIALLGGAIIIDMFQHPGGIGAEKIVGPLLGIVALAFLCGGIGCFYWAKRLGATSAGN